MRVKVDTQVIVVWRHIHVYIKKSLEVPQGFCFVLGFWYFKQTQKRNARTAFSSLGSRKESPL